MPLDFSLQSIAVAPDRKRMRHGKARVLREDELAQLFDALPTDRDRLVFGICYFCAARVTETLCLEVADIGPESISFRGANTKTGESRQAMVDDNLAQLIDAYIEIPESGYLFPGRHGRGRMRRQSADRILRDASQAIGLDGVSTHSFRRSFVTQQRALGRTPHQIRQLTGHKSLGSLLEYFGAS
jgi:integrase/recombinase XerD